MVYQLEFDPYQKEFKQPLNTNHGIWQLREGIVIKLINQTEKIGYGEIAPIPWFGSETLQQAIDFCQKLDRQISDELILSIPDDLPACQFGFESAREDFKNCQNVEISNSQLAGLLPTGISALSTWEKLWNQGYRTLKWKIGVADIKEELDIFQKLIQVIPFEAKLRLDANGGLNYRQAKTWLETVRGTNVEFLEQPLPVNEFDAMLELSKIYETPIALDESVANIRELKKCYNLGWRGVFVIKPAIAGSPQKLRHFCRTNQIDAVFSSVFETSVGRKAALKLASELSNPQRALGFGVNHWFN
ncbi:o-succinylbenzoate synthase [Merismopedia glauca]|uniref:o-succinylbenzoate synthase n=1 Tax=Merismopedia glauca CCAP 1448/3 TaxID=1296344 RepID=A0A2T1C7D2_9CYAN|nr:o-succinylbenzoate synthase [Merismopedia glauca]PSB04146.1 o-succinylbenzoate synthase [Merismopedia glauca CCAP 1448/3]